MDIAYEATGTLRAQTHGHPPVVLMAAGFCKWVQQQQVVEGKLIVEVSEMSDERYIVRRLTPLECCRLQGFPDWWCDGVEGSDSAQYKMWGNGMALPNILYLMQGMADVLVDEVSE